MQFRVRVRCGCYRGERSADVDSIQIDFRRRAVGRANGCKVKPGVNRNTVIRAVDPAITGMPGEVVPVIYDRVTDFGSIRLRACEKPRIGLRLVGAP